MLLLFTILSTVLVLGQAEQEVDIRREPIESKFFSQYVVDRNSLILKRRIFLYRDELYTPWSEWGNCSSKDCTEIRFRKCKNESYEERITDLFKTYSCPFQYIAETRQCVDESLCKKSGPSEALVQLKDTCGVRQLPQNQRGRSKRPVSMKILGGTLAKPHSWPWQVGLYVKVPTKLLETKLKVESPFCGATLIAQEWLVTAAHCLSELVPHKDLPVGVLFNAEEVTDMQIQARLGDHSRILQEANQKDQLIDSAIIHPEYRRGYSENGYDVALLKLAKPVELGNGIDTICLPDKNITFPEGHTCFAAGWGETTADTPSLSMDHPQGIFDLVYGHRLPNVFSNPFYPFTARKRRPPKQPVSLVEVELPLVSLLKCRRYFGNLREGVHVCAGVKGKDTCRGDSGGGLFCEKDGRWQLYGVTSFGSGRGCGKNYGVYTCLRGVSDWVHEQLTT